MSGIRFSVMASLVLAGTIVALVGCESTDADPQIRVVSRETPDAKAGHPRRASRPVVTSRPVMMNPGGISLFGELTDTRRVPFASKASRGLHQHTFTREGADFDPVVDRTGQLLIFASTRHAPRPDIYIKAIGGAAITQITDDPASDVQPQVSPDGKWVAFASDRSGNWDIWVTTIDGQNTRQITRSPRAEIHPTWAPQGDRLAFCALNPRSGQWELWVTDIRQPGSQKFIGYGLFPEWSPKDEVIVFQRARARGERWFSIWTLRLVNGEPRFPTEIASSSEHALISPAWTVDGGKVVYCSVTPSGTATRGSRASEGTGDIWITDADGNGKICLTRGTGVHYSPACDPNGRIYFAGNRSGAENIWSIEPIQAPSGLEEAKLASETKAEAKP